MNDEQITIKDLIAVSNALEMWLDAFSDDEDFDTAIDRVKKVLKKIDATIASAEATGKILRLVKDDDIN